MSYSAAPVAELSADAVRSMVTVKAGGAWQLHEWSLRHKAGLLRFVFIDDGALGRERPRTLRGGKRYARRPWPPGAAVKGSRQR